MRKLPPYSRIIGLDLHPRRFGFAVLEARETPDLLDWGASRAKGSTRTVNKTLVARRLRRLMKLWRPSFVVALKEASPRSHRTQRLVAMIKKEARHSRVSFCTVNLELVAYALGSREKLTKYQRASLVAKLFPFLQWRLPPPPRRGWTEDYQLSIFDAAALALAYVVKRMDAKRKLGPVSIS